MKRELFTRSVYLTIALIVTMAGGCVPVTKREGPGPSAVTLDKTTKARIIKKFKEPFAQTSDGRFFLYAFHRESGVWIFWPIDDEFTRTHRYGRMLIEFDENDVVKRYVTHKCEKGTVDSSCSGDCLWAGRRSWLTWNRPQAAS